MDEIGTPSFFDDLGETVSDIEAQRFAGFIEDPGTFAGRLTEFLEEYKDKNPEQPQLIFVYTVTEGMYKDTTIRDYFTYSTNPNDPDFEKYLGYIKARFEDLGLPPDYKGKINKESFIGVDVIITMVAARPSKNPKAKPNSHINQRTGKPYVNVGKVVRRDVAEAAAPAPAIPAASASDSFFN